MVRGAPPESPFHLAAAAASAFLQLTLPLRPRREPTTGKIQRKLYLSNYSVNGVRVNPVNPNMVFSCNADGWLQVLNCSTGQNIASAEKMRVELTALEVDATGVVLFVGDSNATVRPGDSETGVVLRDGGNAGGAALSLLLSLIVRIEADQTLPSPFFSPGVLVHLQHADADDQGGGPPPALPQGDGDHGDHIPPGAGGGAGA